MNLDSWIAFASASAIILIIPGPTVALAISYALGQGWRAAVPLAIGTMLGDATAMSLSMLGLGALIATAPRLYLLLQYAGAAYLVFLGIRLWMSRAHLDIGRSEVEASHWQMIVHAWLVTALNPQSITFFIAFVPQFLRPDEPLTTQMIVLLATFLVLAGVNILAWAYAASRVRGLAFGEARLQWFNRAGGALLVVTGLVAAGRGLMD